jgi:hypothetical protein
MNARRTGFFLLLVLLALLVAAPAARAAVDTLGLDWWAVAGGGDTNTGGGYTLNGAAGLPATGVLHAGVYTAQGGFWSGGVVSQMKMFFPVIMR